MFLLLVVCRYVFSLVPLPADIASSPPSDNVGSLGSAARRVTYNQETKYQRKQNVSLSLVATTTSYPLLIRADAAFYLFSHPPISFSSYISPVSQLAMKYLVQFPPLQPLHFLLHDFYDNVVIFLCVCGIARKGSAPRKRKKKVVNRLKGRSWRFDRRYKEVS